MYSRRKHNPSSFYKELNRNLNHTLIGRPMMIAQHSDKIIEVYYETNKIIVMISGNIQLPLIQK